MTSKKYSDLDNLSTNNATRLGTILSGTFNRLKDLSFHKASQVIKNIPEICRLHHNSLENKKLRSADPRKYHPVKPVRGEIFNAFLEENIGSELCGSHLVLIVSNKKGNMYAEKVNVVPIEGDGNNINPNYQIKLTNEDLEIGKLDKDPSRIIMTDILTIDKARLSLKIGKVKDIKMNDVNTMLRNQLDLN